jgi:hypothetical protein
MQEATLHEEEHRPWVEEEQRAHAEVVQGEVDLEQEEETGQGTES